MSAGAFVQLQSASQVTDSAQELTTNSESSALCQQCLGTRLQRFVDANAQGAQCQTMLALLEAVEDGDVPRDGFYVSKPWLLYALAACKSQVIVASALLSRGISCV